MTKRTPSGWWIFPAIILSAAIWLWIGFSIYKALK